MSYIQDRDKKKIQEILTALKEPVQLVLFTQKDGCEYCEEAQGLLAEIASLSDKVTLETHDLAQEPEAAAQYNVDKAPAIVVRNGRDYGIRYYGIPSGYEFGSLMGDIVDVSRGESGLNPKTKEALAKLTKPLHLQVFVTPTCPYCPSAVRLAHRMAMESDMVTADMIEATEFPELSDKYNVMAVPRTVLNESHYFEGALPEDKFLEAALRAVNASSHSNN